MKTIQVAAACLNQTPMDWEGNLARILDAIESARQQGVSVLCFPELCLTGYGCEDMFLAPSTVESAEAMLQEVANASENMLITVGLPWRHKHSVFNVIAVLVDGELVGLSAKQHLAGDGVHYEPRWFSPWPSGEVAVTTCLGQEVLIGDLLYDAGGVRVGFEICEDAWVADRPGAKLSSYGVDLILCPSASHFAFGKQIVRERFVLEGSRAYGCVYVYANLLGNESGRMIFDGGAMVASAGEMIAHGQRLNFAEYNLTISKVDLELNRTRKAATASRVAEVEVYAGLVEVDWSPVILSCSPTPSIDRERWSKEDEFTHAEALGLFDYMRKSYSRGFVLSLSGGADSSAIAALVYIMLDLVVKELGEAGVREKLSYLNLPEERTEWMSALLSCVYQASENSGEATEHSAKSLAESLGAGYQRWDIANLIEGYTSMVSEGIGRQLTWQSDDIPLQNIQARVRAPGIWMLANIRNALLVATSNRSEAAVGYATMDGDTCGGISPIAGIDKAFLREWLRWLESKGSERTPQVQGLSAVNGLQPTAELRPSEQGQTDEDDLMPYPILNKIEKAAIRDKRSPQDVLDIVRESYPEYKAEQVKEWVVRFFRLWSRNQWKRERYAPSFHLDDENLDPKTWCRFPILSGGFSNELEQLEI